MITDVCLSACTKSVPQIKEQRFVLRTLFKLSSNIRTKKGKGQRKLVSVKCHRLEKHEKDSLSHRKPVLNLSELQRKINRKRTCKT